MGETEFEKYQTRVNTETKRSSNKRYAKWIVFILALFVFLLIILATAH